MSAWPIFNIVRMTSSRLEFLSVVDQGLGVFLIRSSFIECWVSHKVFVAFRMRLWYWLL